MWASACAAPTPTDPGVNVHRLPDNFGLRSLVALHDDLRGLRRPLRLLVQYVPHAFGWKAMNLPFCFWLSGYRRGPVWVMFHEVAFPVDRSQSWKHNLLGRVTGRMAGLVARSAERVFVSIPAWETILRDLTSARPPTTWLPVPSNLPEEVPAEQVARARRRIAPDPDEVVVGHFGTFGSLVAPLVSEVMPALLKRDRRRIGLLLGREGDAFARTLQQAHPELRGRLAAPGALPADEAAACLAACDLLVQPYPDGASSRRGSLMAGLALGLPIVTIEGSLTEPLWREAEAVSLAPAGPVETLAAVCENLLADPGRRAELAARARSLYQERFSLACLIRTLRAVGEGVHQDQKPAPLGGRSVPDVRAVRVLAR
jgi:glycosyltransferase involved in cell wall biosynthesis